MKPATTGESWVGLCPYSGVGTRVALAARKWHGIAPFAYAIRPGIPLLGNAETLRSDEGPFLQVQGVGR